jgi:hypothetical protein
MLLITMGSRNTVPLRMLRMVPLGLFHIWRRTDRGRQVGHGQVACGARSGIAAWWQWTYSQVGAYGKQVTLCVRPGCCCCC